MYVLAAAIGDPTACDPVRADLRGLLRTGQRRLHWRDEDDKRRTQLAEAVGKLDMTAVVVIGAPVDNSRQERARRKCMEVLLPYLDQQLQVVQVWMETRTKSLNRGDHKMVVALRGRRLLTSQIRVDMSRPLEEPMLWVPDIVAGAVGAASIGAEPRWQTALGGMVTKLRLDL